MEKTRKAKRAVPKTIKTWDGRRVKIRTRQEVEADWERRLPAIRKRLEQIAKALDIPQTKIDELMKYKCKRPVPMIEFCDRYNQDLNFIYRGDPTRMIRLCRDAKV
jgi:hypothetical protein